MSRSSRSIALVRFTRVVGSTAGLVRSLSPRGGDRCHTFYHTSMDTPALGPLYR